MRSSSERERIDRLKGRRAAALEQLEGARREREEVLARLEDGKQAQAFLQRCAERLQVSAHARVGEIVSKCVSAVFPDPYELRVEFVKRRGRTEAEFSYHKVVGGESRRIDPKLTSGGVKEVASLALRIVSLALTNPPQARLLVLDEPFGGVSRENLPRVARCLESLSRELGLQFLVVTHSDVLEVGRVVRL